MHKTLSTLFAALVATVCASASAQTAGPLTVEQARQIVAPFYRALNRPATQDVDTLLGQATSPDWTSCGGNNVCAPRQVVIGAFKNRGKTVPDLAWDIKDIQVAGDTVIVRGEATGTPAEEFLGVAPAGKSFRIMSIDVHTIAGGKMVRSYHVEDWAGAARQLQAR